MAQYAYLINNSNDISSDFANRGGMYVVQLRNGFLISPTLYAELTGLFTSKVHMGYFVAKPSGNLSIGARKMLLNNKMTFQVLVNDILGTLKDRGSVQYGNVNYSLVNVQDSRFVSMSLRYNFGSTTVRAARSRQTGIEDEATRAGGR